MQSDIHGVLISLKSSLPACQSMNILFKLEHSSPGRGNSFFSLLRGVAGGVQVLVASVYS